MSTGILLVTVNVVSEAATSIVSVVLCLLSSPVMGQVNFNELSLPVSYV